MNYLIRYSVDKSEWHEFLIPGDNFFRISEDGGVNWTVYKLFDEEDAIQHNGLAGIQGGLSGERYHLSQAQHTDAVQFLSVLNEPSSSVSYHEDKLMTDWLRWTDTAARSFGGVITSNGDGTVAITAGSGIVHAQGSTVEDCSCGLDTSPGISETQIVNWVAVASLALTDNAYNYIYVDGNDSLIKATTDFYSVNFTRAFTIGRAYREGTSVIVRLCGTNKWNFNRRVQLFGEETFPVLRAKGMALGSAGTRNITITAGILWAELVNRFTTTAFDSSGAGRFTYYYRNGSGGWTKQLSQSQINNTQYDDGSGTLSTLTAARYGVHWVYVVHDNSVHVVFGQGNYTLAQADLATPPASLPGLLSAYATLVGKIEVQKSSDTLAIQSAFETTFNPTAVTNHNDLAGIQGGVAGDYQHLTSTQLSWLGQDVRTTATPQFTRLGIGTTAHATIALKLLGGDVALNSDRTNISEGSGYWLTLNAGTALTGVTGGPNRANIELGTDKPDGNSLQGSVRFFAGLNTVRPSGCNIGTIDCETVGSTANDRGGLMSFWTKQDGEVEAECFYLDQSQRATFLQNVIINAPTTGKGLTVNGKSGQFAAQFLGNASASNSWGCYIQAGSDSSDYPLYILSKDAAPLMFVRGDGRIGVGTYSPDELLHVAGNVKTAAPTSGTAKAWKLGNRASVSPTSPNRTIEVEVDGVTLYLHAKTTND